MTKAIFFDLDGVLTTDAKGSLTMSKNLCEMIHGLSVQEVLDNYREDIEALNIGRISMSDVWKRMCASLKIPDSDELLNGMMRKAPKNDEMFDLARFLCGKYRLGIITDNSRERVEILTTDMQLNELFDPIIISAAEHASKNDGSTTIFDAALRRAACNADEAVFIDNQERNLLTPAKMGMKTYLHDDTKNDVAALKRELQKLGIDLPS